MKDKSLMSFLFGQDKKEKDQDTLKPETPSPTSETPSPSSKAMTPNEEALKSLAAIREALAMDLKSPTSVVRPVQTSPAITEANRERSKDRKLYEALLTGLYDGVVIFDAKGSVIGSNKRAEQFFGYNAMELWNMPCDQLIPALGIRVLMKIKTYAESGRFTVVNASCTRKDKSTFPAEIAISRINLLNEGDLILSIRNLERREKARQRHEMEIEALRWTGAGIIICDSQGMIEYANPAMLKLLHIQEEKDILKHFVGEICTSYESAIALLQSPSTHGIWLGKLELRTPDGHTRDVLAIASLCEKQRDGKANLVVTMIPLPMVVK
ncbi:MAG: PAS domain-containing protein [Kiritimatiellae bacterium]|nr:PAS domain-containing protein [Kiritimatiellia bacterium]MDD5522603.1 PAS domain-containing protein [Kiritimatiellia bacterium]